MSSSLENNFSKKYPFLIILLILFAVLFSFAAKFFLFAKAFPANIHIISLVTLLVACILGFVWRIKVPNVSDRERQLYKSFKPYTIFMVILGIIAPLSLIFLMLVLLATGNL